MNYGRKGHGENVEFERFASYVLHCMKQAPRYEWRKAFQSLTENTKHDVNEIRKYREAHAAKFNYDAKKIYQDLKEKENLSTFKKVTLKPRKYLKPTGTSSSE